MPRHWAHSRLRGPWGLLVFLLAVLALLLVVSRYYLLPAMRAAAGATDQEKQLLTATSRLMLAVILFVIGAGLVVTFRVSRFFFPRSRSSPKQRTHYVDAWSESGKRLRERPDEEPE